MGKQHRVWVKLKDKSTAHSEWMGEDEARFELNRINLAVNFGLDFVTVGTATSVRAGEIDAFGVEENEQT